jgi:hypothetical protein
LSQALSAAIEAGIIGEMNSAMTMFLIVQLTVKKIQMTIDWALERAMTQEKLKIQIPGSYKH